ncbi:hypothetical protein EHI8A_024450 [Entamoeba histolytica HM-1:IMSS-B]|uniref:Uncharacterized protein n=6 Tax=Entamoeba histolytica TaxID=5759 RepID=C4M7H4_ENTH1|nr:hypothetical protein EHI_112020 [Entamoeba histolytica HM-1:IMSS]EMD43808.1 Hypothetical protein EHI5A_043840 [Entamoeba histolytica KU27]EMH72488.1 hypothetical protein EHI8A_024450 [Entamoeba histolytica HM-1:IMSS-B]EMS16347.1 hypothetical protein KM1_049550 [Entamoeba histolytica HM-3:IMSS]ENY60990.1 hypothetical protein EHI7A_023630 [Entamoeba histolytica HM-1:IMSS-A]EAL47142.2 hypothetical protein EHI_112020 [Entamoeba histolytica HM-1:IMSS]|eukprot:XP_652530.2 hypothetical protein EHI_112020 [Entamoeba histolytica HM-1:IMSS]
MRYINHLPRVPVECKHLRVSVRMDDLSVFEPIEMEEVMKLNLSESISYGVNVDMSLPEVNYVPLIEEHDIIPMDDILFGIEKKTIQQIPLTSSFDDKLTAKEQLDIIHQSMKPTTHSSVIQEEFLVPTKM